MEKLDTDPAVALNGTPPQSSQPPQPPIVVLSSDVAAYLLQVLLSVTLSVAGDNFEVEAAMIVRAKKELKGA